MSHSQSIGSKWKGKKYVHGPRRVAPKKCKAIRLGKRTKTGTRLVWCKLDSGRWVIQSKITPRSKGKGGRDK